MSAREDHRTGDCSLGCRYCEEEEARKACCPCSDKPATGLPGDTWTCPECGTEWFAVDDDGQWDAAFIIWTREAEFL